MVKILTENDIKKLIKESLITYLNEGIRDGMSFGTNGPIPIEPAKNLCEDINPKVLELCDNGERSIPYDKIGNPNYFGNTLVWKIYQQYSVAISRRSDLGRKPVGFFLFLNRIRNGWKGMPLVYYQNGNDYLLGVMRDNVFLCVYICPSTVGMGLFKFIKNVCQYDNVVFAVTDDMASMLDRLGCPKHEGTITAKFRGSMHEKQVFGTTQKTAEKGAKLLGLFSQVSKNQDELKKFLNDNPEIMDLYKNNTDTVMKLLSNPLIMNFVQKTPKILPFILSNPALIEIVIKNPLKGMAKIAKLLSKNK